MTVTPGPGPRRAPHVRSPGRGGSCIYFIHRMTNVAYLQHLLVHLPLRFCPTFRRESGVPPFKFGRALAIGMMAIGQGGTAIEIRSECISHLDLQVYDERVACTVRGSPSAPLASPLLARGRGLCVGGVTLK